MRMNIHLEAIAAVVNAQKPPVFIQGKWLVPKDVLHLSYEDGGTRRSMGFPGSLADCETLSKACKAATFGMNDRDVLDENYRKAGKIDRSEFSIAFDSAMKTSMESAAKELLTPAGELIEEDVRVRLYKLNVYGPGSFFKSHKDTPRSDDMYGSMVIVLPTEFKGGELIFRHDGQEHMFDSHVEVNTAVVEEGKAIVPWTVFFSDVDHEVLPVTEGYRVTLTYNLYHSKSISPSPVSLPRASVHQEVLSETIQRALRDPHFFPDGCQLGFGLKHKYPATSGWYTVFEPTNLSEIVLKGYDATLMKTFSKSGIKGSIRAYYGTLFCAAYQEDPDYTGVKTIGKGVLKWIVPNLKLHKLPEYADYDEVDRCFKELWKDLKEVKFLTYENIGDFLADQDLECEFTKLLWVTPPSDSTRLEIFYVAFGNEPANSVTYVDLNLVFAIPSLKERGLSVNE